MADLEPDVDPWTDTVEQRGLERDDPFDHTPESPFGIAPESVGIPNMVRSVPRTGPSQTSRPRFVRTVALIVLLTPIAVGVAPWVNRTLSAWLG